MAEKLSSNLWSATTRKHKVDLDDAALVKALARLDKTDESKADARVDALGDVVEQVNRQVVALARRKKELGDKVFAELKDRLDSLRDLAEAQIKEVRSQKDDEEDSPALLTSKMTPLLRELRKGEVEMSALACTAGKNTAVLIMRKPIAASRRKILQEAVDAAGGAKFLPARCLYEGSVLTFVMETAPGGLAKRLRQALIQQVGLKLKVRVRGSDGQADEDGEDGDDGGDGESPLQGEPRTTGGDAQDPDPAAAAAAARMKEALAKLLSGVAALAGAPAGFAGDAKAMATAAREALAGGQLERARELLFDLGVLLKGAQERAGATAPPSGETFPKVAFEQLHLRWDANKKAVQERLDQLAAVVVEEHDDDEALQAVTRLAKVLAHFNLGLGDRLDALRNAGSDEARRAMAADARGIADDYLAYLESDELVLHVEANPYGIDVGTRPLLSEPLRALQSQLAGIGL